MRIFEIYRKKILDHPHGYFLSLANCNISKSIAFGMQKKKSILVREGDRLRYTKKAVLLFLISKNDLF